MRALQGFFVMLAVLLCGQTAWSEAMPTYDMISDGTPVTVRDGEFVITPPTGWEVYTKHPSLTMLMQIPHAEDLKYQRTIQIAGFSGKKFIDETTAAEFAEVIRRKFSNMGGTVADFEMRNHQMIDMADGRKGILYYASFKIDETDLMQAHILVSSAKRHYLITYTDIAEHVEGAQDSPFLTEAWASMTSMQFDAPAPARFESVILIGIGVGVLLGLIVLGIVIRRFLAARRYQEFAASADRSGHGTGHGSAVTGSAVTMAPATKWALDASAPGGVSGVSQVSKLQKTGTMPESGLPDDFDDEE